MRIRLKLAAALALAASPLPAWAACKVNKLIDLPVTLDGMKPLVDASINGHPVRFVLDSGAFFSMLSPGTAGELALPRSDLPPGYRVSGIGGDVDATIGKARDFTVSGVTLHNMEFLVGGSEVGAAGLLGQNILGFRDAEYDLGGGMVRLMTAQGCSRTNLAYWANGKPVSIVDLIPSEGLTKPVKGVVHVNGISMRAQFDTGATGSLITAAAAARAGVRVNGPGVEASGFGGGLGRRLLPSWIGQFQSVDIGGEQIRNTQLRIERIEDMGWDMLIGADFFLSHRLFVANSTGHIFLTYNGGPVFRLRELRAPEDEDTPGKPKPEAIAAADATAEPTDPAGFARRGAARLARRDMDGALADLDRAVKGAPGEPRYLIQRGQIHMLLRQPLLAANDLDAAIKLQPDNIETRLLRASLRLRANDHEGAREDTDVAAKLAAKSAHERFSIAELYGALDQPEDEIAQLDLWIAAHPEDSLLPVALNDRCWMRALASKELPKALADCDAALRRSPNTPNFLDSRGLVHLRMGDYDKAIADYDHALAIAPKLAFSLHGRGLAKLAKGDAAGGKADIAAAAAIDPRLPARARRYGLAPPG